MKLLRLFRKVSSLVGHRAQCSPIERLLSCSTRRISSFADWDSCPVNNRVYFSRKMNPADLVDVIKHFEENPIFESILSNKLVGKATSSKAFDKSTSSNAPHKNPFLEAISKMNLLMMSRAASVAFRSLPELYLENHLRGIFLGARISLSNVRIHKPSGKFVFFDNEQGMSQELPLVKHSGDLKGLAGLVRELIDILYPGITLPSDLAHWLSLLEEVEPTLWLVMYHPVFLSLKGRFLYHVALDQATRKEFERGNRVKLMEILRKLAKFKGLFGLAALHELLKSQMDKSRKKSKTRSKQKKAAAAAAAAVPGSRQAATAPGSPQSAAAAAAVPGSRQAAAAPGSPQSAAAAAAVPGSRQAAAAPGSPQSAAAPGSPQSAAAAVAALNVRSGKRKRAKSRKSCSKRQSNGTSSTGNTIQSAEQITFDKQKQELSDGRDVVSFIRDCPVHGCENMCVHFLFVEVTMLSQEAIVQLVHFIFRDYGHEALQAFFNAGLSGVVGIEGLFGEEPNTWREAMHHQTMLKDTSS